MNKRQVKGTANDAAGKIQQQAGKLTGSKKQQVKGIGRQVKGKVQKALGDIEEDSKKRR